MQDTAILSVPFFHVLVVCVLGLCLGSFATALLYRIPKNIPWVFNAAHRADLAARSKCPHCNHVLGFFDLIPLFSWLFARGACRYCGARISTSYPATELLVMGLVVALFLAWGWGITTIPVLFCVPFLVAAAKIDWDSMLLPDSLTVSLLVLSLVYVGLLYLTGDRGASALFYHVVGGLALPAVFWALSTMLQRLKGRPVLGRGDIKFLVPAGLFLGGAPIASFLVVSGGLGLASAALKGVKSKNSAFPFGPALIIAFYIHLFLTGIGFYDRGVNY